MKHCILVIGNVAAGKSTLSKVLAERLNCVVVCLDDSRVEVVEQGLGNGRGHADRLAQELCLRKLTAEDLVIFESTGVTRFYSKAIKELVRQDYKITKVMLMCDQETCWDRYKKRKASGHFQAPFAYAKGKNIKEGIRYFHWEQKKLETDLKYDSTKLSTELIADSIINTIKTDYSNEAIELINDIMR
ncbi:hypothetical protein DF185_19930 [Marinifilum breve]|uniref:Uncharacterized protein n=1 Tax=Marinifilum breve TaxID=2184082 RepID=A0A2V3ZT83_9BACT|nr:AAA family ATPase [Marinifilum breve]PXX96912.1 hypothetical protein DF185_19930 [Marinifilum breve]